MIKIGEIDRWLSLKPGTSLMLKGLDARTIRIDVNAIDKARLFLTDQETGEERFLATVIGNDRVEFVAAGNVCVTTPDTDVYVYTSELEEVHMHFEGAEIYTRIAERIARNPELEYVLERQALNFERRFQQMATDIENQYAAREAEILDRYSSPSSDAKSQSEPDNDGGEPNGDDQ